MRAPLGWQASSLPIVIRWPISAPTAPPASAVRRACRSVRPWRCKGTGRIPVAVFGDGEFLMTPTALWTGGAPARSDAGVIANNRGYYIDEQHRRPPPSRVRPARETASVGQRMYDPEIDLTALARAQGFADIGAGVQRV